MKIENFKYIENYALEYKGIYLDLHNDFDIFSFSIFKGIINNDFVIEFHSNKYFTILDEKFNFKLMFSNIELISDNFDFINSKIIPKSLINNNFIQQSNAYFWQSIFCIEQIGFIENHLFDYENIITHEIFHLFNDLANLDFVIMFNQDKILRIKCMSISIIEI